MVEETRAKIVPGNFPAVNDDSDNAPSTRKKPVIMESAMTLFFEQPLF